MITRHTLSDALQYIRGVTFDPDELVSGDEPGAIACMRTKNVQKELDESDLIYVPKSVVKRDEQMLRPGDLLISSANSWELVGKTVRVNDLEYPATAGGFISILRPNNEVVDPNYLYRFIAWDNSQHAIRHLGRQTTNISNLDRVRFLTLPIPLPPLETQKHIARVLEQADQLRKQAQQMESELNQLAQSLFLEMFGDPVTNPKKWPLRQLSDIASAQLGKMLSEKSKMGVSPKKYLRNANVQWRNIKLDNLLEMDFSEREMKKFEIQYGDLLICEGGEVGRCAIWRNQLSDCYYQKALHRVRVMESTVAPEYLQEYFYWMATLGGLNSSVSEVTFSHLTAERLNILKVPVPPYKLQEHYTNKIALVEKQRELVMKLHQKYEDTFNSLMQRAFKGELTPKACTRAA